MITLLILAVEFNDIVSNTIRKLPNPNSLNLLYMFHVEIEIYSFKDILNNSSLQLSNTTDKLVNTVRGFAKTILFLAMIFLYFYSVIVMLFRFFSYCFLSFRLFRHFFLVSVPFNIVSFRFFFNLHGPEYCHVVYVF